MTEEKEVSSITEEKHKLVYFYAGSHLCAAFLGVVIGLTRSIDFSKQEKIFIILFGASIILLGLGTMLSSYFYSRSLKLSVGKLKEDLK